MPNQLQKITLKNGLRLILVNQPQSLAATVLIFVKAGSEYETKRVNGISHFLEHLTFKGTTKRPKPGMIAEELTALGAQFNAFTSQEYTGYWAKTEAHKLPAILEIVSDLYLHPLFDALEIEKERGVIIEEINMYEDNPGRKVQDLFSTLLYGDQPAGWDVLGEKSTIRSLGREDFVKYREGRYVMPNTVIVVAGKLNVPKIKAQVRKEFGTLPKKRSSAKPRTHEKQSRPATELHYKDSGQSHLVLGFRGFDLFDPRRYAIQVLADILGGGMSSRLWKRVREELGAAYYVSAETDLSLDHGFFAVSAGVDHAKIEVVIRAILEECRRMRDDLVPEEELRRSKDHMIGGLILGLETSDELASFYGSEEIFTSSTLSPEALTARIKKVTAKEIQAVAKAIFRDGGLNLAVIGPYKEKQQFKNILTID